MGKENLAKTEVQNMKGIKDIRKILIQTTHTNDIKKTIRKEMAQGIDIMIREDTL